jgi:hypothetical protein
MKKQNFFQKVFQDPKFKENLLEAKKIASETSLETGFEVGRKFTEGFYTKLPKDYMISGVKISEDDNSLDGKIFVTGPAEGLFDSIDVHFHNNFYMPSTKDIHFLNQSRKWDYNDFKIKSQPLMAVASYTPKKTNLFLIQEKQKGPIKEEDLEEFIKTYENLILDPIYIRGKPIGPERTIEFFNLTNLYNCDMISFNDSTKISKKNLEKLSKFDDYLEVDEKLNEIFRQGEEEKLRNYQEKLRR